MVRDMHLTSSLLTTAGFRHAFFTRIGGVSEPPFMSLNFSASVGDLTERVEQNFSRAAHVLGVATPKVLVLTQVHGVGVIEVDGESERANVSTKEGDALIAAAGSIALGVRSADCVPVLVADRRSGAVAAIHSGWKGTAANVTGVAIAALRDRLGGQHDLIAAIGPHISLDAFEVGEEVATQLATSSPLGDKVIRRRDGEKPHVDLRAIVTAQLEQAGVVAIDHVMGCTVGDAKKYFSFRRDGTRSGRMLSAIVPKA